MPHAPSPQPLLSACALCAAHGFTDALDLQMHTASAHFRPVEMIVPADEDFIVVG